MLFVLFAALGIGLGLLYSKLVIKNYPESERKGNYIMSVVVFLVITVALFGVVSAKIKIDSSIKYFSHELEQYVAENHSNLAFVRNGLAVEAIQNDVARLNSAVTELTTVLWPRANELGLPKFAYDMAAGFVADEVQKRLVVVNFAGGAATNLFVDENNFVTVSSLLNGLHTGIMKIVNIIVLVVVGVLIILLGIYIFSTLSTVAKERKRIKALPETEGSAAV
ncbi:MAG: hypothetical protein FWD87_08480 [Spirochaetaceae bacterium]|nr:hypothetical protein [Spirochaetaceae bacterium]